MKKGIRIDPAAVAGHSADEHRTVEVGHGIAYKRIGIVNVEFIGDTESGWFLVDAGLPDTAWLIRSAAEERFGREARPRAILLTHGHFDHVGGLLELAKDWDVPVYCHRLEAPYLTGRESYPPPDPRVGGGLMARIARLFPRGPIDVGARLRTLPDDGTIPGLAGWQWFHTPGHTAGHVSYWREADRSLVAGDAFVTTRQESIYAAITQREEINGPPAYYTQNWSDAEASVRFLASLEPEMAVTGHGRAMHGPLMREKLGELVLHFQQVAVPEGGYYVSHPVMRESRP